MAQTARLNATNADSCVYGSPSSRFLRTSMLSRGVHCINLKTKLPGCDSVR